MPIFMFRVYVAGSTARADAAVAELRGLCEGRVPSAHAIEVVDVLANPQAAEDERVLATPMVMRLAPLPRRRVIGDLADPGAAARALGLPDPAGQAANEGARA